MSASFGSLETVILSWLAITSQDISWLLPIIIEQSAFSDRSLQQPFIVLLNHTLNTQKNNTIIPGPILHMTPQVSSCHAVPIMKFLHLTIKLIRGSAH